ncbi:peptidoglycan-binding domain-containing protein [Ramlibacter cellulosilyticus]|nr:peptidoglycan-binding domain-containing protein [Ramlibacter cellulosilyticus]
MSTGDDLLAVAAQHLQERYVLGARVPKDNAGWTGPWDCAEFASWCLFQVSGKLFGCDRVDKPAVADAFTGFWKRDATAASCTVPVVVAKATRGAFLLRFPAPSLIGHIAISDGKGGTLEAHSTATGVIRGKVDGRRWDVGVLPPMIHYDDPEILQPTVPPGLVLRLRQPNMRGALIERLQRALLARGFSPGDIDGAYGPHTAAAVHAFQLTEGLLPDGEAGDKTLKALGLR